MLSREVKGSKNSKPHKYKFIDLEITTLDNEITPLGNNANIKECLKDFAEIYNFNVTALKRNNEPDSDCNNLF